MFYYTLYKLFFLQFLEQLEQSQPQEHPPFFFFLKIIIKSAATATTITAATTILATFIIPTAYKLIKVALQGAPSVFERLRGAQFKRYTPSGTAASLIPSSSTTSAPSNTK